MAHVQWTIFTVGRMTGTLMDQLILIMIDSFVEFCMSKVRLLLHFNVRPIMVFDGGHLPMKSHQEALRSQSRRESRAKATELLSVGDSAAAYIHVQKSTDVTPQMAARLIDELKKMGIEYVVAPYEADAQMAWLDRVGLVEAVITEDSDLLLFGCKRVLFKLDKTGYADEICIERLGESTELDLRMFPYHSFRHMCMLSGCDYLPSIHGMGLKTAYKYLSKYRDIQRVLQILRAEMPTKMPPDYEDTFARAEMTFLHQRVYDVRKKLVCFLNPLPQSDDYDGDDGDEWNFLGPPIEESHAREICEGRLCPFTLEPFRPPPPIVPDAQVEPTPSQLPFEIHLDRKPTRTPFIEVHPDKTPLIELDHNKKPTRTFTLKTNAIDAVRLSLKRSFNTTTLPAGQENQALRGAFAFGNSGRATELDQIYLQNTTRPSNIGKRKALSQPLPNPKQRSVRDFFKFNES